MAVETGDDSVEPEILLNDGGGDVVFDVIDGLEQRTPAVGATRAPRRWAARAARAQGMTSKPGGGIGAAGIVRTPLRDFPKGYGTPGENGP